MSMWRAADLFPLMSPDELKVLGEDIKKNGMKMPIVILHTKDGEWPLLDGRNRLDALEAVGVDLGPLFDAARNFKPESQLCIRYVAARGFISGIASEDDVDPYAYVASVNLQRRHLTPAQQRELIDGLLKENPQRSDRETARIAKADQDSGGTAEETRSWWGISPPLDPGRQAWRGRNLQRRGRPLRPSAPRWGRRSAKRQRASATRHLQNGRVSTIASGTLCFRVSARRRSTNMTTPT